MGSHGGRDTVEEKKSSSQPGKEQEEEEQETRPPTHTHTHAHTRTAHTQYAVQRPRSSTLPSFPARGRGERKGKEGEEGVPLARTLPGTGRGLAVWLGKGGS